MKGHQGAAAFVVLLVACGQLRGTADEPTSPPAASSDASADAGAGLGEGGAVDAAADGGVARCQGNQLRCGSTCVSSCAECATRPIECFACDTDQKNPIGTCEPLATAFCLSGDYSKAYDGGPGEHCDCSDHLVSNCPGIDQVCLPMGQTDWCITCGQAGIATTSLSCKNGRSCNTSATPPRCQ